MIQDGRYRRLETGYIKDVGYRTQDTGNRIQAILKMYDPGRKIRKTG